MATSYLGIVSTRGLELLIEETEHVGLFLARRCYRRGAMRAALCWATLDAEDAEMIREMTHLGLQSAALWRLNRDAHQLGGVLPTVFADGAA